MTDMNTGHRDFNADSDALMGRSGADGADNTSTTGRIGDKVRELASTAKEKAGDQARTQLDTGKTRAASALRDAANSFTSPNAEAQDAVSRYMRTAGDQVRRAADYLENRDVREMVADAENFARRQPALFLSGAFVVGLVAARILKSSRQEMDGGMYGGNMNTGRSSIYDRETSLNSFREPGSQYGGMGTTGGMGTGGAMLGDSANRGTAPGTGTPGSGLNSGASAWTDDLGASGSTGTDDPYANE